MQQYIELLKQVLTTGTEKPDRTGTGVFSCSGLSKTYDLSEGFPLLWLKKVSFHNIKTELLWFLGNHKKLPVYKNFDQTNVKFLVDRKVNIWNDWAYKNYVKFYIQAGFSAESYSAYPDDKVDFSDLVQRKTQSETVYKIASLKEFSKKIKNNNSFAQRWGELGPVYGKQWRDWNGIDQLAETISNIKENPYDRGHLVNAWNVSDLHKMALRPCHVLFQLIVSGDTIDLVLYQRSGDLFIGIPYNIASYSLLLALIAQVTGFTPGKLIHTIGDAHIYKNHLTQAQQVITRWETKPHFELPVLKLNKTIKSIDDFTLSDIEIENYKCYDFISAPIAV